MNAELIFFIGNRIPEFDAIAAIAVGLVLLGLVRRFEFPRGAAIGIALLLLGLDVFLVDGFSLATGAWPLVTGPACAGASLAVAGIGLALRSCRTAL